MDPKEQPQLSPSSPSTALQPSKPTPVSTSFFGPIQHLQQQPQIRNQLQQQTTTSSTPQPQVLVGSSSGTGAGPLGLNKNPNSTPAAPPTFVPTSSPSPMLGSSPVKLMLEKQPLISSPAQVSGFQLQSSSSPQQQSSFLQSPVKTQQHPTLSTLLLPSGSSQHTQFHQQQKQQQPRPQQHTLSSSQFQQQQQYFQQQKLQQHQQLQAQQKQMQQQKFQQLMLQQQQQNIQQQQQNIQQQHNIQQQQQQLQKQQLVQKQQQQQKQQIQQQQLQQQQQQQQHDQLLQLQQQNQQFPDINPGSTLSTLGIPDSNPSPTPPTQIPPATTTPLPLPLPLPISVLTPTHKLQPASVSSATGQTGHRSRKEKLICRISTDADSILVQSSPPLAHPSIHLDLDLTPSDRDRDRDRDRDHHSPIDSSQPTFPSFHSAISHIPVTVKVKKPTTPSKATRPYNRKKSNSIGGSSAPDLLGPSSLLSSSNNPDSQIQNQNSSQPLLPSSEKKSNKASLSKKVLMANAQKKLDNSNNESLNNGNSDDPSSASTTSTPKTKGKYKTKDKADKVKKDKDKPTTKRPYKRKSSIKPVEVDQEGNPAPIPATDKVPLSPRSPLSPSKLNKEKVTKRNNSKSRSPIVSSNEPVIKVPSGSNRSSSSPSGSPLKFAKFSRNSQGLSEQETALLPMLSKQVVPRNRNLSTSSSSAGAGAGLSTPSGGAATGNNSTTSSFPSSRTNKSKSATSQSSTHQIQNQAQIASALGLPHQGQPPTRLPPVPVVGAADLKFFGPPGVLPIFKPNQKPWNLLKRLMEGNDGDTCSSGNGSSARIPISPGPGAGEKDFELENADVDVVGVVSGGGRKTPGLFPSFEMDEMDVRGDRGRREDDNDDNNSSDCSSEESDGSSEGSDDEGSSSEETEYSDENVTEMDLDLDDEDIEDLEVVAVPVETVGDQLVFCSDDRALFERLLFPDSQEPRVVTSRSRFKSERSHSINSMDEINGEDCILVSGSVQQQSGSHGVGQSNSSCSSFPLPLPSAPSFGSRPGISMSAAVANAGASMFNSMSSESPSPTTESSCPAFPQPIHQIQSFPRQHSANQSQTVPESYQFTPIQQRETPPSPVGPISGGNSSSTASAAAKWAFGQSQYGHQNGGRESPCGGGVASGGGSNSNSNSGYGLQHRFQPPSPSPSSVSNSSNNGGGSVGVGGGGGNSGRRYSRRRHSRMYPPFETSHCMFSKHFCPAPLEPGSTYCIKHVSENYSPYYVRCAFMSGKTGRRCQNMQYSRDGKNKFCNMHATRLALLRQKLYRKPRPAKRVQDYFGDIRRIQNKLKKPNRTEAAAYLEDYCDYKLQTQCMENEIEMEEPMETLVMVDDLSKFQAEHDSDGGIDVEDEYECLKNAGYYTTEEVVRILKSKLSKLRELYVKEFDFLKFYYLMKRQDFLVAEDTIKASRVKYSRNPKTLYRFKNTIGEEFIKKEFRGYEKTKTLLNYHKLRGQLAVLHHLGKQRYEEIKEKEEKEKLHAHTAAAGICMPRDANDTEGTESDLSDEEDQGNPIVKEVMEHSKTKSKSKSPATSSRVKKKCKFQEEFIKCENVPLPSAKYCHKHILKDENQVLFEPCNYPTDENEWCVLPLLKKIDRSGCDFHRIFRLKRFRKNKKEKKSYDKVLRGMPRANLKEQMRMLEELVAMKLNSVEEFDSEVDYLRQRGLDCSDTSNSDIDNDFEYEDSEDVDPVSVSGSGNSTVNNGSGGTGHTMSTSTSKTKDNNPMTTITRRRKRTAPVPATVVTAPLDAELVDNAVTAVIVLSDTPNPLVRTLLGAAENETGLMDPSSPPLVLGGIKETDDNNSVQTKNSCSENVGGSPVPVPVPSSSLLASRKKYKKIPDPESEMEKGVCVELIDILADNDDLREKLASSNNTISANYVKQLNLLNLNAVVDRDADVEDVGGGGGGNGSGRQGRPGDSENKDNPEASAKKTLGGDDSRSRSNVNPDLNSNSKNDLDDVLDMDVRNTGLSTGGGGVGGPIAPSNSNVVKTGERIRMYMDMNASPVLTPVSTSAPNRTENEAFSTLLSNPLSHSSTTPGSVENKEYK